MTHATIPSRPAAPRAGRLARTAARLAATPLLLAALAACSDDDGIGPGENGQPSNIAFAYSGSGPEATIQGTYQAMGDPPRTGPLITETFALGQRVASKGALRVMSNAAQPAQSTANFAQVTITRLEVGSVAINGTCPGETCNGVSLAIEVSTNVAVSQARYSCALETGTIRITSIRNGRAQGDFTGTGSCLGRPGTADLDQFSITGGTFDVKVIDVVS